jgi:hypothetical protein
LFLTAPSSDAEPAGSVAWGTRARTEGRFGCGMGPGAAGVACAGSF